MAGYVVKQRWEPFVRYEYLSFDRAELPATAGHSSMNDITAGVNYYFLRHRAKLTGDVMYLPTGSPVDLDSADILANPSGSEIVFQLQFQLMI